MREIFQLEGDSLLCRMLWTNPSIQLLKNLHYLKPFSIFLLMIKMLAVYYYLPCSRISKGDKTNCLYNHLFLFYTLDIFLFLEKIQQDVKAPLFYPISIEFYVHLNLKNHCHHGSSKENGKQL